MQMQPKAELHVHLDGTVHPQLMQMLAGRNKLSAPMQYVHGEDAYRTKDFAEFLVAYDAVAAMIQTPEDLYDITFDYLRRSAAEGVVYTELTASPNHAANAGMSYETQLAPITEAMQAAEEKFGIVSRIINVLIRHLGIDAANRVAEDTLRYLHPLVTGLGLAGDETVLDAKDFKRPFLMAQEAGLGCTAHAGEGRGAESVRDIITHLPVSRLGHGVRAIEDASLIDELIARDITLEVCPSSNIALKVFPSLDKHPLRKLFDAGVKVTLNSDDPPFFETTIGQEYALAESSLGFSQSELSGITKTAIESAFLDSTTKNKLLES